MAGADIKELAAQTPVSGRETARRGRRLFRRIERLGKPVIAAINGFALGGGCELALACTFRFAADTARIGLPEITLGLLPGYGGSVRLPRLIGKARAMEMILTGRHVTADEAFRIGPGEARGAGRVAGGRGEGVRGRTRGEGAGALSLRDAVDRARPRDAGRRGAGTTKRRCSASSPSTADDAAGTAAFLEKRKPAFKAVRLAASPRKRGEAARAGARKLRSHDRGVAENWKYCPMRAACAWRS